MSIDARLSEGSRLTLRTSDTTIIGGRAAANLSEASSFFNTPQTDEAKKFIAGELLI
jgi:hypothetical protein